MCRHGKLSADSLDDFTTELFNICVYFLPVLYTLYILLSEAGGMRSSEYSCSINRSVWLGRLPGRHPLEVFKAHPTGRKTPRTHWRDYMFHLDWESLRILRRSWKTLQGRGMISRLPATLCAQNNAHHEANIGAECYSISWQCHYIMRVCTVCNYVCVCVCLSHTARVPSQNSLYKSC